MFFRGKVTTITYDGKGKITSRKTTARYRHIGSSYWACMALITVSLVIAYFVCK